jgi:hypothetical protein
LAEQSVEEAEFEAQKKMKEGERKTSWEIEFEEVVGDVVGVVGVVGVVDVRKMRRMTKKEWTDSKQ